MATVILPTPYTTPTGEVVVIYPGEIVPDLAILWVAPTNPPSSAQIVANLTAVVQAHLDATARTRNYDGILSLCSYAASADQTFGHEGRAGVAWRDAVWARCYAILADVQAGSRVAPSEADLIAELPMMVWPV